MLVGWNHVLHKESVAAAVYVAWERRLQDNVYELMVPETARDVISGVAMTKIVGWLVAPPGEFGADPLVARDSLLIASLNQAVLGLDEELGSDWSAWRYGQPAYKHALIRHPLSAAVDDATRRLLDVGPAARGGNSYTVNNTGRGNNQTSGASFRFIIDTGNWDGAVGANTPGQSGDPDDPHYRDLFDMWANDRLFPVYYSRHQVELVSERVDRLVPR
jgi:penicillin amidase